MNKQKLIGLVKKEVQKLKEKATQRELSNLSFDKLNPKWASTCIYGLMTGSCWTERANKLIIDCTQRVYEQQGCSPLTQCDLNGKPFIPKGGLGLNREYFSPIECFISFEENKKNGNNENLLNYLKGKDKKLVSSYHRLMAVRLLPVLKLAENALRISDVRGDKEKKLMVTDTNKKK